MAGVIRALAETQGHAAVSFEADGPADLIVVDGDELHPARVHVPRVPILVVSGRRLRDAEISELKRAGATRVLDRDASILDLAFAFSDLLFLTRIEQRRYAKALGGVDVEVACLSTHRSGRGRLLGVARCGAILLTENPLADGTRIEMRFPLDHRPAALRGRVAYTAEQDREQHVGIEFALDDVEVAPKLHTLIDPNDERASFGVASVSA